MVGMGGSSLAKRSGGVITFTAVTVPCGKLQFAMVNTHKILQTAHAVHTMYSSVQTSGQTVSERRSTGRVGV